MGAGPLPLDRGPGDLDLRRGTGAADVRVVLDVLRRGDLDGHVGGGIEAAGLVEQVLVARDPGSVTLDVEVVLPAAKRPSLSPCELLGGQLRRGRVGLAADPGAVEADAGVAPSPARARGARGYGDTARARSRPGRLRRCAHESPRRPDRRGRTRLGWPSATGARRARSRRGARTPSSCRRDGSRCAGDDVSEAWLCVSPLAPGVLLGMWRQRRPVSAEARPSCSTGQPAASRSRRGTDGGRAGSWRSGRAHAPTAAHGRSPGR